MVGLEREEGGDVGGESECGVGASVAVVWELSYRKGAPHDCARAAHDALSEAARDNDLFALRVHGGAARALTLELRHLHGRDHRPSFNLGAFALLVLLEHGVAVRCLEHKFGRVDCCRGLFWNGCRAGVKLQHRPKGE